MPARDLRKRFAKIQSRTLRGPGIMGPSLRGRAQPRIDPLGQFAQANVDFFRGGRGLQRDRRAGRNLGRGLSLRLARRRLAQRLQVLRDRGELRGFRRAFGFFALDEARDPFERLGGALLGARGALFELGQRSIEPARRRRIVVAREVLALRSAAGRGLSSR